jgi:hypothetical protein
VNNDYDFYTDMVVTAKELNDRVYNLIDFYDNTRIYVPSGGLKSVYPEADANYQNETNEGTQENLEVKAKDPVREAIVRFDLTSLPEAGKLDYAGFKITGTRTITDPETNIYAIDYVANNQWTETGIKKSTMPASSPENYPWRAIYSWDTNTGITVNVTYYVKKALSQGATKISFKIRVDTQGTADYMAFGARENASVEKRPALLYAEKNGNGIETGQANQSFACYPNPSKGIVNFRLNPEEPSVVKIDIYTPQGQLYKQVYEDKANSGEITIPAVVENKGVYIVRAIQGNKELLPVKLIVN